MMMGSTEAKISEVTVAAEAAPEVLDDFDVGVNEEVRARTVFVFFSQLSDVSDESNCHLVFFRQHISPPLLTRSPAPRLFTFSHRAPPD